jgi:hypothetical protein
MAMDENEKTNNNKELENGMFYAITTGVSLTLGLLSFFSKNTMYCSQQSHDFSVLQQS